MNFDNVKTTITAYPTLYSDILAGYVPEAPSDGKTYARRNAEWVEIRPANIYFYYGATNSTSITKDQIRKLKKYTPDLEFKDQSVEVEVQTSYPSVTENVGSGGIVWFCSTVKISSIASEGKNIGYLPQIGTIELDNDQYYCYRTSTTLSPGTRKFKVTFDIDSVSGKCPE